MHAKEIKFANLLSPIIFAVDHSKIQSIINQTFLYGFSVQ
jgi:hypothetical protein